MRFGVNEAHGRGAAVQYAYFRSAGAVGVDEASGKLRLDFAKLETAIRDLTRDFVIVQGDGDYEKAKSFLDRWAVLDAPAKEIIASLVDIPVDIQPAYPARVQ
jgi:hypothetical protein